MKRTLLIALALCLCCVLSVSAVAAPLSLAEETIIQPRFQNIRSASCVADIIDGYLCIDADLDSYGSMPLRITAKVTAYGMSPRTFTESTTGDYLSFYREIPVDDSLIYTITFTYNAGGEIHTETLRV